MRLSPVNRTCLRMLVMLLLLLLVGSNGQSFETALDLATAASPDQLSAVPAIAVQQLRAKVARAIGEGRIGASGSWHYADGSRQGSWQLLQGPSATAQGWQAQVLVEDVHESSTSLTTPARKVVAARRITTVVGTLSGSVLQLTGSPTDPATESQQPSSPFVGTATGTLRGVRLEGTFAATDGASGSWSGFWDEQPAVQPRPNGATADAAFVEDPAVADSASEEVIQ